MGDEMEKACKDVGAVHGEMAGALARRKMLVGDAAAWALRLRAAAVQLDVIAKMLERT